MDRESYALLEARAEQAYAAMYDAPRYGVKDCFDDALAFFHRAIEAAEREGRAAEAERLKQRAEHVRSVYNAQFRFL